MQWDDELAAKRRVVLDAHFLKHLARDADVTQVDSSRSLWQWEGEAQAEGPLRLHSLLLPAHWRIYTEHRGSVLIGPVSRCPVPWLLPQKSVLMRVKAVNDQVHRGIW